MDNIYNVAVLDKGMVQVLGRMEQDSVKFHTLLRIVCKLNFVMIYF
jgi:hypothetical protein